MDDVFTRTAQGAWSSLRELIGNYWCSDTAAGRLKSGGALTDFLADTFRTACHAEGWRAPAKYHDVADLYEDDEPMSDNRKMAEEAAGAIEDLRLAKVSAGQPGVEPDPMVTASNVGIMAGIIERRLNKEDGDV